MDQSNFLRNFSELFACEYSEVGYYSNSDIKAGEKFERYNIKHHSTCYFLYCIRLFNCKGAWNGLTENDLSYYTCDSNNDSNNAGDF